MSKKTKEKVKNDLQRLTDQYVEVRYSLAIIGGRTPKGTFGDTVAIEGKRDEIALAMAVNMVADPEFDAVIKQAINISIQNRGRIEEFITTSTVKLMEK